jgi:two-component system, NtrC family, response regulator GlrR
MRVARVIIIDPEADRTCAGNCSELENLADAAFPRGAVHVTTAERIPSATRGDGPDLVMLRAPARSPVRSAVREVRKAFPKASVLGAVCGGSAGVADLVDALRDGLDDFLCCPFTPLDLAARLRRLLSDGGAAGGGPATPRGALHFGALVGDSGTFRGALARLSRIAASSAPVLVSGETGVGKGLFARAIHYSGARRARPFVPVNCSALPEHLFENELFGHGRGAYTDASSSQAGLLAEADSGTLFLDEIDTLVSSSQAKLLRFLQDGEYRPLGTTKTLTADIRVIAATNADLAGLVSARRFRQDLFHRLNVLCVEIPPLRARPGDVPLLAEHFVARYRAQYGRGGLRLTAAAMRKLVAHRWPGNVRELESLIHRAVVFAATDDLDAGDVELPGACARAPEPATLRAAKGEALDEFERTYITRLLGEHQGNVSHAARASGRDRRSFQRLLRKHGLSAATFRGPDVLHR